MVTGWQLKCQCFIAHVKLCISVFRMKPFQFSYSNCKYQNDWNLVHKKTNETETKIRSHIYMQWLFNIGFAVIWRMLRETWRKRKSQEQRLHRLMSSIKDNTMIWKKTENTNLINNRNATLLRHNRFKTTHKAYALSVLSMYFRFLTMSPHLNNTHTHK